MMLFLFPTALQMNTAAALLLQEYPAVSLYLKASQKSNHLLRQIFFPLEAQHLPYSCKKTLMPQSFLHDLPVPLQTSFFPQLQMPAHAFSPWIFSVNSKYIFAADS